MINKKCLSFFRTPPALAKTPGVFENGWIPVMSRGFEDLREEKLQIKKGDFSVVKGGFAKWNMRPCVTRGLEPAVSKEFTSVRGLKRTIGRKTRTENSCLKGTHLGERIEITFFDLERVVPKQ